MRSEPGMPQAVEPGTLLFPVGEVPLLTLRGSAAELLSPFGIPLHEWEEDGLGRARGAGVRLPSGCGILLTELLDAPRPPDGGQVTVDVAMEDLARLGGDRLADEILAALRLGRGHVAWMMDEVGEAWHRDALERWLAGRRGASAG
jgi:hypothetical protein